MRLVRAGVNPTDWKLRAGVMPTAHDPEVVPGQDGAAWSRRSARASPPSPWVDRVWLYMAQHGRPRGTAAELTVPAHRAVARCPTGASYDLGASLGVPAMTAHRALTAGEARAGSAPAPLGGRTVLVAGGAGAVGNAAIQLAVWAGATVITTVSGDEKAALARAAGCAPRRQLPRGRRGAGSARSRPTAST